MVGALERVLEVLRGVDADPLVATEPERLLESSEDRAERLHLVLPPGDDVPVRALAALETLGYRPVEEPGRGTVLRSHRYPQVTLVLLHRVPFDFDAARRRAVRHDLQLASAAVLSDPDRALLFP